MKKNMYRAMKAMVEAVEYVSAAKEIRADYNAYMRLYRNGNEKDINVTLDNFVTGPVSVLVIHATPVVEYAKLRGNNKTKTRISEHVRPWPFLEGESCIGMVYVDDTFMAMPSSQQIEYLTAAVFYIQYGLVDETGYLVDFRKCPRKVRVYETAMRRADQSMTITEVHMNDAKLSPDDMPTFVNDFRDEKLLYDLGKRTAAQLRKCRESMGFAQKKFDELLKDSGVTEDDQSDVIIRMPGDDYNPNAEKELKESLARLAEKC